MKRMFSLILSIFLGFFYILTTTSIDNPDPVDFFLGAQRRPKLQIIYPENGQILPDTNLEIKIKVDGYEVPSSFHDSKICIALSAGSTISENCFEQSPDLIFHAKSLLAGSQYALRVALYERGNAIAVSVRNFCVAGIKVSVDGSNSMLTIQSAMQVAISYQTRSMIAQAEAIYRSILEEDPTHPDALHLLGVVYYQRGDPSSGIPYIERALLSNKTYEGFHNSLGECYRTLGRLQEAKAQFALALALNPNYMGAIYNMGLTYQQDNDWEEAITYYNRINDVDNVNLVAVSERVREESRVRECDLLQALGKTLKAMNCWKKAIDIYPNNDIFYNELGNLYVQAGNYEDAIDLYQAAINKGSQIAQLNAANLLELQGFYEESRLGYSESLNQALQRGLPIYHIRVRMATVLPRIIPASESLLQSIRGNVENELDELLHTDNNNIYVDNSQPLYFGFSQGYFLAFHVINTMSNIGDNNVVIKSKLSRVYLRMCPALHQGYFMESNAVKPSSTQVKALSETNEDKEIVKDMRLDNVRKISAVELRTIDELTAEDSDEITEAGGGLYQVAIDEDDDEYDSEDDDLSEEYVRPAHKDQCDNESGVMCGQSNGVKASRTTLPVDSSYLIAAKSTNHSNEGKAAITQAVSNDNEQIASPSLSTSEGAIEMLQRANASVDIQEEKLRQYMNSVRAKQVVKKDIRIGFVSRFIQVDHPVGALLHGLVPLLSDNGYEISIFHVGNRQANAEASSAMKKKMTEDAAYDGTIAHKDPVKATLDHYARFILMLPMNIGDCTRAVRSADLDVLVYPEIGNDPVTYFMAFAKLVPVQVVWFAHPDTTGLSSIDYYLSSDIEIDGAEAEYSEALYKMHKFGTVFVDVYSTLTLNPSSQHISSDHQSASIPNPSPEYSPRSALLRRAKLIEEIGLPRSARLYGVAHPLYRLHPQFDVVLTKILVQDRLGYIMIIDATAFRRSWQKLFISRLTGGYSDEVRSRVIFFTPDSYADSIHALSVCHVILDPFPITNFLKSLQALAVSVPVVTLPSKKLGGRLTYTLYRMLGYGYDNDTESVNGSKRSVLNDNRIAGSSEKLKTRNVNTGNNNINIETTVGKTQPTTSSQNLLVVSTVQEYIRTALAIAHNPKLREQHVIELLNRRHLLFQHPQYVDMVLSDWNHFIDKVIHRQRHQERDSK